MPAPLIPWRVFFHALRKKKPRQGQIWLQRWAFADAGVALADGHEATPLTLEEKGKIAAFFITKKRPKNLH
jgi:hypothetical protein